MCYDGWSGPNCSIGCTVRKLDYESDECPPCGDWVSECEDQFTSRPPWAYDMYIEHGSICEGSGEYFFSHGDTSTETFTSDPNCFCDMPGHTASSSILQWECHNEGECG
eukprot:UN29201